MKRQFVSRLLALAAVLVLATPLTARAEEAVLQVGLEDYYPPFAMSDADGGHTGFDHDVARALCEAMQRPCAFVVLPFDDLLDAMRAGRLDMVLAGLAASEERRRYMDFTDSYYRSRSIYIGRPGQVSISREGLKGKKIGTQLDTMQAVFLQKQWGDVAEVVLSSYDDILNRLCAGELDAVLVDGLPGYDFLKSERGSSFEMLADPLPPDLLLSHARIGVRKNAPDLIDELNAAIVRIRLNGEYDRITRKYFSYSIY